SAAAGGDSRGACCGSRGRQAGREWREQDQQRGSRGYGFPANTGPPSSDPLKGGWAVLLLYAGDHGKDAVPGSCCAASAGRTQLLPEFGVVLHGMQPAKRRKGGWRFFALAVPRAAAYRGGAKEPVECARRAGFGQAATDATG